MPKNKTGRKSLDIVNNDPRIAEVFHDQDGYWLFLNIGYTCERKGAHDGHEYTVTRLLKVYRGIELCDCEQCKQELSTAKGG